MTAAATLATVARELGEHATLSVRESVRESAPGSVRDLSDHEVVLRARDGDHGAFRVLVERHESRVYGLSLRLLRDPDWARDAVQEAFIKAYRGLRKFEGRSAFGTWMYRLTYNHCLDMRRADKSGRLVEWDEQRPPTGDPVAASSLDDAKSIRGPGEEAERGELREQLAKAIETLPDPIRETLVMREIDGLSYGEIASTLEIPKGTVMSRLFHARKRLREILIEQGVRPFEQAEPPQTEERP
jgi:RNA polymerase sigma-70 factor (ECF subfamily)